MSQNENDDLECLQELIYCGECANCIEWDRTFDIDAHEENKRQRIAEENEY